MGWIDTVDLEERVKGILASLGDSSDVKSRRIKLAGDVRSACLIYIEGTVDTDTIKDHIIEPLLQKPAKGDEDLFIPYLIHSVLQVPGAESLRDSKKAIEKIVDGWTIILFEGIHDILAADTTKWAERALSNPKGQRSIEGPDIGFTENRAVNVALIRKYLKNSALHVENRLYGKETSTTVSLVYLENMVDQEILKEINRKLEQISLDSVIASNYISEYLQKESKTIFPLVLNTDRPDVAVAEILEGRVCIIVDGTPFSLIAPAVFIQYFQSADDYFFKSESNKLVRPLRFLVFWISLYIPALYVAFTTFHKGLVPVNLLVGFLTQRETVPFPAFIEVILVLFLTDAIFEASSRLPQGVVVTSSLFGAIVFGQASVEAQLVQPITLVIISTSFIFSNTIPIASFSYATRILKYSLILVGSLLGLYGLALFTLMLLVHLCYLRSFTVPYLAPISPFNKSDMSKDVFSRKPIPEINKDVLSFHKEEPLEERSDKENDS
ncbi:spore germination protein [Falsibacillus pallidus]|uniref:spore germination protein n=1 Tax=Falsibacillus pallidus TaxID=493781 RepID=UPI003D971054